MLGSPSKSKATEKGLLRGKTKSSHTKIQTYTFPLGQYAKLSEYPDPLSVLTRALLCFFPTISRLAVYTICDSSVLYSECYILKYPRSDLPDKKSPESAQKFSAYLQHRCIFEVRETDQNIAKNAINLGAF